jgi:hypothetical protein
MAAGIGFRAPALKLRCPRLASASRRHAVPADMDSVIARNGAFGASPPSSRPASKSRRAFSLTEGVGESARVGRRGGRFALSRLRGRIGERAGQGRSRRGGSSGDGGGYWSPPRFDATRAARNSGHQRPEHGRPVVRKSWHKFLRRQDAKQRLLSLRRSLESDRFSARCPLEGAPLPLPRRPMAGSGRGRAWCPAEEVPTTRPTSVRNMC